MPRNALSIHDKDQNGLLPTVWWKPLISKQKEMSKAITDSLFGASLENMFAAQEEIFEKLEDNVSNMFTEVFNTRQMLTPWVVGDRTDPYIDIIESKDSFKVKAELPGVKEQDINISLIEGGLQIAGEKYEECAEKDENYRHQECHTGYFCRAIALPENANLDKAEAIFNLNVLTVKVPKIAQASGQKTKRRSTSKQRKISQKPRSTAFKSVPKGAGNKVAIKEPKQGLQKKQMDDANKPSVTKENEKEKAVATS